MAQKIACIFDLDGVIVDTAHFHFLAWGRLAKQLGIPFSKEANEQLKGVSRVESLERILKMGNTSLPAEEKAELRETKNGWYRNYVADMTPADILPGVKRFLDSLKAAGIPVGLATSSKNRALILESIRMETYFDTVVDGTMITHSKPDPEIFLTAAEMLNYDPVNCVVFEDAIAGIKAALAANMTGIGVGKPEVLTQAHHVIPGFREFSLPDLFTMLNLHS